MTFSFHNRAPFLLLAAWTAVACSGGGATDDAIADARPDAVRVDAAPDTAEAAQEAVEATGAEPTPEVAEMLAPDTSEPAPDAIAEAEATPEVTEVLDAVGPDGGDADTETPPLVSACVNCHTDKALLVALLPEEPTEEADHGGG